MKELPELIISDIMMPLMDGFALLEKLKAHEVYRKIPVIMLTARADIQDKLAALRIGVDDYLVKPFVTEELIARINNLLEGWRQRQSENDEENYDSETTEENTQPDWLLKVEETVKEKLRREELFTVDDIATLMGISTRQLQRNIKAETGLTLNNYIKEIRLHVARQLLEQKIPATLAACSLSVGFNDPHYFSKLFFERFGKKPSEYFE
jgi:YesN/AraC family two-component response regulator